MTKKKRNKKILYEYCLSAQKIGQTRSNLPSIDLYEILEATKLFGTDAKTAWQLRSRQMQT